MTVPKKAMLLAAGAGTRLRPLTYETPKPMVPVVNRPVIHHVLDNLLKHGVAGGHGQPPRACPSRCAATAATARAGA